MRWGVKPGMFDNVSFRVPVGGEGHVCSNEGHTSLTPVEVFCDSTRESFGVFKNNRVNDRCWDYLALKRCFISVFPDNRIICILTAQTQSSQSPRSVSCHHSEQMNVARWCEMLSSTVFSCKHREAVLVKNARTSRSWCSGMAVWLGFDRPRRVPEMFCHF